MLTNLEDLTKHENRKFKDFPNLDFDSPISSISNFKNYYIENFGLKAALVNSYIHLKNNILNEDPIPNKVVKGLDGWYFLGNHHNNIISDSFGNDSFSENELNVICKNIIELNAYFVAKKIKFYLVIPPNKSSIYREQLPYQLTKHATKFTSFKNSLEDRFGFKIIDLSSEMLSKKNDSLLYMKTDTHWNDYGAFIGYSKVIDVLNAHHLNIPKVSLNTYRINHKFISGDITPMINNNTLERTIVFEKKSNTKINNLSESYKHQRYYNPDGNKKLLMFRDSFANAWTPYFSESFKESVFLTDYIIDYSLIEKENPDVVILEVVERNFLEVLLNLKKRPS
ncbi:hypothetical protein ACFO5O_12095 [Geojedonia litorea]|uniref:AlgX/AlgJ SGNH hydrolase-like domain-containing protein n=1 Tax=Geojedonia litorea TaxID=1268269 RepID=A0ABV9N408_9FLAO